jgi:hypothetical protein
MFLVFYLGIELLYYCTKLCEVFRGLIENDASEWLTAKDEMEDA